MKDIQENEYKKRQVRKSINNTAKKIKALIEKEKCILNKDHNNKTKWVKIKQIRKEQDRIIFLIINLNQRFVTGEEQIKNEKSIDKIKSIIEDYRTKNLSKVFLV